MGGGATSSTPAACPFETDTPWTLRDFEPGDTFVELTLDMGRPVDQIAAGMDGKQRINPEMPSWLLDQTLTAEQGLRLDHRPRP